MNGPIPFEQQFAAALVEHGLQPGEIVADGKLHRFDGPDEKRGKRSAWYVLHGDGLPAGSFGDWRTGLSETWCAKPERTLTDAERQAHRQRIEQAKSEAAAERAKVAEDAAAKCVELWNIAGDVDGGHAYIERKGIKPTSAKQLRDALLIPLRDAGGELRSLQFIQPDGSKRFKTGGTVAGCYCALGGKPGPDAPLLICEGWATACSLHEATCYPVAAAMNAGNLLAVAQALRAKLPDVPIIVCADDDIETAGNPGLTKAREAAQAIGALLAVPDFGQERPDEATDFNDVAIACGGGAVLASINAARNGRAEAVAGSLPAAGNGSMSGDAARAETDEQTIERLASLNPMQYDRVRKAEAKRMGVQNGTLDRMVKHARGEAQSEEAGPFEDAEPWPDPVDGAALLSEIARTIRRFIICDPETIAATALWCQTAWLADCVSVCPILLITAPEKSCGKSQLLTVAGKLVPRPAQAAGVSSSVLFRMIEKYKPTLLLDEIETVLTKEAEDLRGLLNAGHTRDSAFVWRSVAVGDDFEPKRFNVFGFKALAGINADKLAETITSRAVVAQMRRKMPHETAERLRQAEAGLFDDLRAKLARWADDNAAAIRVARPDLPDALGDRDQDNWEPLLAVADLVGGTWPSYSRSAAIKLCNRGGEAAQSAGAELLADIKAVFDRQRVQRISMADLLAALCEDDEAPWKTWNRGKEMTPRQLGKKLREYGIESQPVKIAYETSKGYKVEQFEDAFARYLSLSPATPLPSVTQLQPNASAGLQVTDARLRNQSEKHSVTRKPNSHAGCNRVTEKKGATEEEEGLLPADESEGEL
uniref:DNA primase n=1 Tax=Ralstonia solanacearum TaxID=305 RepID=A0A809E4K4_RALSL